MDTEPICYHDRTMPLNKALLRRRVETACITTVNRTMASGVLYFKQNHAGWKNRTGRAERSVRVVRGARVEGTRIRGVWGSVGVNYMPRLERFHGMALANAAAFAISGIAERLRREVRKQFRSGT